MRKYFLPCLVFLFAACRSTDTKKESSATDVFTVNMDTTVNPADDFFDYANGGWIKQNPIPADESEWGIGYLVDKENDERLLNINQTASENRNSGDMALRKIGDFWVAAMDTEKIENEGLKYLQPYLDSINAIQDLDGFINAVSFFNKMGLDALMNIEIRQDDKISDQYAVTLWQGGLGLPDRDYYFNQDTPTVHIRRHYIDYMMRMFKLLDMNADSIKKSSYNVYTLETRLAMFSKKLEDLRDPYGNYHKMNIKDLRSLSSKINWPDFLQKFGIHSVDSVIVGQPDFYKSFDNTLTSTSINTLKNYLIFHLVDHYAKTLPQKFVNASFDFEKNLSGATQQKPRWKTVLKMEQNAMGELLGQLYVKKYFDSASKNRYETMAQEVSDAYSERIKNLEWMSDSTKQKAIVKLEAITRKIGYPDKWKDFSAMKISDESYFLNMVHAAEWWHNYEVSKLGKPVDRGEWGMYPQTYDAYYNPSNNEIVFPAAAFIVPGYADSELDDAVMYGYAGASYIGHEITHGFDDQGRLYDAKGNLHNWWSPKDSAQFAMRAEKIIKQFDAYEPVPGFHINGRATQGENIADLGGIEIGLDAFMQSKAYKENKTINGFTPIQRFFMGYALSWLYEIRPELLRTSLMTDVHSPAKFRVIGPLSNVERFYKTYNVQPGNKMYRADSVRVKIW